MKKIIFALFIFFTCTTKVAPEKTNLHRAAKRGDSKILEELLKTSSPNDLHARDKYGFTPLHVAAYFGQVECVQCLIAHGANVNTINDFESTPLHDAVNGGYSGCVRELLAHGAHTEVQNIDSLTPLHLAAMNGDDECLHALLTHDANVNAQDNTNWTPLHFAAISDYSECAQELMKHHANINAKNADGKTPAMLALEDAFFDDIAFYLQPTITINTVVKTRPLKKTKKRKLT